MHRITINEPILDTLRIHQSLSDLTDQRGKIARMLESGELISLRRGLYAGRHDLDPLCLAGSIYGPSYISYETALAWHGMIPDGVTEILSATVRRAATFSNDYGRFRYFKIPKAVYPLGIQRIVDAELPFLIASPTKALADGIAREAEFRSMASVGRWMKEMRVDVGTGLNREELRESAQFYGRPAVRWLMLYAEKNQLFTS